jgi:hypothetical protein
MPAGSVGETDPFITAQRRSASAINETLLTSSRHVGLTAGSMPVVGMDTIV